MTKLAAALCVTLSLGLAGCTGEIVDPGDPGISNPGGGGQDDDVGGEVEQDTDPVDVPEPEMSYHGAYEVTTTMDVAGSGVLGEHVGGTLVLLSEFHDNPAGTILGLLALYDVPIISTIYDVLPGFLEDEIEGWLNDAIFDALFDGLPAVEQAVIFVDDVASISRNVEMVTDLELERPNVGGGMSGSHRIRGFGFTFRGTQVMADVPVGFADLTAAETHASLTELDSPNPALPQGLLELDRHSFGIPYGEMLMQAIADLIYAPLGVSNLGELLDLWVNCAGVAEWIGDRCILGACVSDFLSVDEMEALCTDGLGLIGFIIEESIRALRFDLLDMNNGRCEMYDVGYEDTTGDWQISSLADGQWDLSVTFLGQTYIIENSFEGRYIGE